LKKKNLSKKNESIKGYLFTITYNAIKKHFLKKRQEEQNKKLFTQHLLNDVESDASEKEFSNVIQEIEDIVETMPERRSEVFILSKKEGLTIPEIATHLSLSEKTVKNHLTLAFQTIREKLPRNFSILLILSLFY
jgi:RNA polymerase sigma-70 factor (ECF subfamily)